MTNTIVNIFVIFSEVKDTLLVDVKLLCQSKL